MVESFRAPAGSADGTRHDDRPDRPLRGVRGRRACGRDHARAGRANAASRRISGAARRRALGLARRGQHPHRLLELRHGGRLPAGPGQRRPERLPLGRGAQGQRHELQRRHHAVRAREDHAGERRRRVHHGDRLPRAAGRSARTTTAIMRFEPRPGLLPGRPGAQPRPLARPSATTRAPGPTSGPTSSTTPTIRAGRAAGTATSASGPSADQESFMVMDDDYYDAWDFDPGQPRLHAPRAGPAHRGARLPVGEPAGRAT